jgi:phosphatidylglycerophosphate synthase
VPGPLATAGRNRALALLAQALTGLRAASAPPIFLWIGSGDLDLAAMAVAAALLSDCADGPLVRRFGTPSAAGAWFDAWADFLVIVAAFGGLAAAGMVPAWPLLPICLSFALFVATTRKRPVLYDPVGRYIGGILMVLALVLLTLPEFLVQETVLWTSAIACSITMLGRVAYVLPRGR